MVTSLEKITRGLEARERRSSLFDGASSLIVSSASIQAIREKHDQAVQRHAKVIGDVETVLADFDEAAEQRYREFRAHTRARIGDNGNVVQESRSPGELAEFRAELKAERQQVASNALATVKPVLDALTKEIADTVAAVGKSAALLQPLALADSYDFGSEEMSRLIGQCERLGPQALRNLALRALAIEPDENGLPKDKRRLIAAIATVNSGRDSSKQEFSSAALVQASPFAAMAQTSLAHAEHIDLTGRHALNSRDRLVTGRGDASVDKIESGLRARETADEE